MSKLSVIYYISLANILERVRRYSFLIVLGATLLLGYTFVPPVGASYTMIDLGDYRGIYNSAWVGSSFGLMTSLLVSLPGFFLVKNSIERDRLTGVGEIIAATPVTRLVYLLGKAFGNLCFLSVMTCILAILALLIQLVRAEELSIDLWALWSPFLLIVMPMAVIVASLAIFFETLPLLRGGFGNAAYIFLWLWVFISEIGDLIGLKLYQREMGRAIIAAFPEARPKFGIMDSPQVELRVFRWDGFQWESEFILSRLLLIAFAFGIIICATILFDRFDSTRGLLGRLNLSIRRPRKAAQSGISSVESSDEPDLALPSAIHLSAPGVKRQRSGFFTLVLGECRLMLKGQRWWWHLLALALIVVSATTTIAAARQGLLPVVWLWPLTMWSAMGTRERRYGTDQIIFSAPNSIRQIPAMLVAGIMLTMLAASGVALKLIIERDQAGLIALLIGSLFIPSLALALGVWSGSGKLFEVVYVFLWYLGAVEKIPSLDFMGSSGGPVVYSTVIIYSILTLFLLQTAIIGRQRRVLV